MESKEEAMKEARRRGLEHILAQNDSDSSADDDFSGFILPSLAEISPLSPMSEPGPRTGAGQLLPTEEHPEMDEPAEPADNILTHSRMSRYSGGAAAFQDIVEDMQSMPSWVDNLHCKWKDEIKYNMDGDLQDWFIRQQMEVLQGTKDGNGSSDHTIITTSGDDDDELEELDEESSYFRLSLDSTQDQLPQEDDDDEEEEEDDEGSDLEY